MKKLICLLLCLVLLVSCGSDVIEPPPPDETCTDCKKEPCECEEPPAPPPPGLSFQDKLDALEPFEPRTEIISRWHDKTVNEFIPGDYGRLYPFPAAVGTSDWGWGDISYLYGLMTADGKIVVDGVYERVDFIDIDDGYYRLIKAGGKKNYNEEVLYITADGSRKIDIDGELVFIGEGKIRVFEYRRQGGEYIGVVDLDGNIISPFINAAENFYTNGYGLYMNKSTGEAFYNRQDYTEDIISASLDERGELTAIVRVSDNSIGYGYIPGTSIQLNENTFFRTTYPSWSVVDKDGNIIERFTSGVYVIGKLITRSAVTYDYDLNELVYLRGEPIWSPPINDNLYIIGRYEDGMSIVDISDGSITKFPNNVILNKADETLVIATLWQNERKIGLYTITGEEVLPLKYDHFRYIGNGLYEAQIDNYIGVIRQNGEWLIRLDMLRLRPD